MTTNEANVWLFCFIDEITDRSSSTSGEIVITSKAIEMVREIAVRCRDSDIYKANEAKQHESLAGQDGTAHELIVRMAINALKHPWEARSAEVVVMMVPQIDDAIAKEIGEGGNKRAYN